MMEAGAIKMAKAEQRLDSHDERINSLHSRMGEVQIGQSDQNAFVKVLANEIAEARSDIDDAKSQLSQAIGIARGEANDAMESMQRKFDKKFETLTSAVRWGTGTMVALIGILVTILFQVHA